MMNKESVAVLLPVYKNDNICYLKESVGSILNQTHENKTIYIGVDGPVGHEIDSYLKEIGESNSIHVTRFNVNRGLAAVLNDLLQICLKNGHEFIARMDADDISLPERFARQKEFLESHTDVDVVGGKIEEIDEQSQKNGKGVSYPLTHMDCLNFFRYRDPLAHPAVMFRKSFFNKVKGYRNEYRTNQDTLLWYDGFLNGAVFANLPDSVLLFRVTDAFYRQRRNGWKRAQKMLADRFVMNRALHYDLSAYIFALMMFCMTLSPAWLKRVLYRIR